MSGITFDTLSTCVSPFNGCTCTAHVDQPPASHPYHARTGRDVLGSVEGFDEPAIKRLRMNGKRKKNKPEQVSGGGALDK